jgi:hypothetical protein
MDKQGTNSLFNMIKATGMTKNQSVATIASKINEQCRQAMARSVRWGILGLYSLFRTEDEKNDEPEILGAHSHAHPYVT